MEQRNGTRPLGIDSEETREEVYARQPPTPKLRPRDLQRPVGAFNVVSKSESQQVLCAWPNVEGRGLESVGAGTMGRSVRTPKLMLAAL